MARFPALSTHTLTRDLPSTLLSAPSTGARELVDGTLPTGTVVEVENHGADTHNLPPELRGAPTPTIEIVRVDGYRYKVNSSDLQRAIAPR